jgi:putative transposase
LNDYSSVTEVRNGLGRYFSFYNGERLHQSLNYKSPLAVVYGLLG